MNPSKNSGFLARIFAALLDRVVGALITLAIVLIPLQVLGIKSLFMGDLKVVALIICLLVFLRVLEIIYTLFFVGHFGGTIGKLLFGLRIVDRDSNDAIGVKRAFYRNYLGYLFSSQFFGLGFLRIIKHPEKLSWHDELFNTKVVSLHSKVLGILSFIILPLVMGFMVFHFVLTTVQPGITGIMKTGSDVTINYSKSVKK